LSVKNPDRAVRPVTVCRNDQLRPAISRRLIDGIAGHMFYLLSQSGSVVDILLRVEAIDNCGYIDSLAERTYRR
jgi:hypothetical protein